MKRLSNLRRLIAALAIACAAAFSSPAFAQQAQAVDPTASAVQESQLLQSLQQVQGRVSIPDEKSSVLIQPAGRDWRYFHDVTLRWIGGIVILGMLVILVAFYLWRGMVRIESGRSGRRIVRFNAFERFVHWMTATSFIVLAITGLNVTFGKELLLPLIGPEAFSAWSQWAKYAHNYISFAFTLGVVLILVMWIGGNIPNRLDIEWLKRGGGFVENDHPPARRFNAGQKAIYWIQVLGGAAIAISGYVLMFPFYGTTIDGVQLAQMVHGVIAMLFIAVMLAHIYIGTIGEEGAFEAMGSGEVDLNWAKQHHSLWVEEEMRRAPAGGAPRGAPAE